MYPLVTREPVLKASQPLSNIYFRVDNTWHTCHLFHSLPCTDISNWSQHIFLLIYMQPRNSLLKAASSDQQGLALKVKWLWSTRFRFYFEPLGTESKNKYKNSYHWSNKHRAGCFSNIILFVLFTTLQIKHHVLHFMDKKTVAQRSQVTCTGSHSCTGLEMEGSLVLV